MKTEATLQQLQKEVNGMKLEIRRMKKKLSKPAIQPIIIEKVNERSLTATEKRHMLEADTHVRAGRRSKFVTLSEFAKIIEKRRAHPLE